MSSRPPAARRARAGALKIVPEASGIAIDDAIAGDAASDDSDPWFEDEVFERHEREHTCEDFDELDELDDADDRRYPELSTDEQELLRNELQARLGAYLSRGRPRVVITDNVRTMLSIKRGQGVYTFRLHHMFVEAPPRVLRAVASYAETQDAEASELLRHYIDVNDENIRARTQPRPFTLDVQGRWHNLQDIFDDLNARYFQSGIQARITWGPRARRKKGRQSIKLGSYTVDDQLIRIHPVLDAEDVPRFIVAWVVYHEMLHQIHDMPIVDGRRVYHTREFRRAEAQFEQYAEAVLWERTNLHKLLDR